METIATRQAWDLRLELLPERYQGKNSVIRTDTDVINQPRIARDSQQLKTAPIARNARVSTAINRRTRRLISAKLVDESAVDPGFIVSREAAQRAVDTHGFVGCVVFLLAIIQLKSLPARGPVLSKKKNRHSSGAKASADIAGCMNAILADVFALYMKTKNFHWHMSGPHFRDYHLLLDEQADHLYAMTDPIAERIRKTGGSTLRSIGHIARIQRIKDNDADYADPRFSPGTQFRALLVHQFAAAVHSAFFAGNCETDHPTRSARKAANGAMSRSILALSRARR